MSDTANPAPGDFQIDAKLLHTGNFLVDKLEDEVVKTLNHLDLNHDGKPDVAEVQPLIEKAEAFYEKEKPLLAELEAAAPEFEQILSAIDWEHLGKDLTTQPWVKDAAAVQAFLAKMAAFAAKAKA